MLDQTPGETSLSIDNLTIPVNEVINLPTGVVGIDNSALTVV